MKQIIITVPDNCELKQDGNIYTIVEKEKKLTYEYIVRSLFSKDYFFIGGRGEILKDICRLNNNATDLTNCTSERQAEKLLAINKLMNVAKYLNGDWQPDWNDKYDMKWYIFVEDEQVKITYTSRIRCNDVYFKSKGLSEQAIEILGEETIKLALCTDY